MGLESPFSDESKLAKLQTAFLKSVLKEKRGNDQLTLGRGGLK